MDLGHVDQMYTAPAVSAAYGSIDRVPGARKRRGTVDARSQENSAGRHSVERHIRVGAIAFPRLDQIDLTSPVAVLSRLPNASFQPLWKTTDPVRDFRGLGFVPDAT